MSGRPPSRLATLTLLAAVSLAGCGETPTRPSETVPSLSNRSTIAFGGLAVNQAPLVTHAEAGFVVSRSAGGWEALTTYGNPAPFIQFRTAAGETTAGVVTVTRGGGLFALESIDLYSSVTSIPYEITGLRGRDTALALSGTVGNTLGSFRTVTSDRPSALVDTLFIKLTNGTACCENPMGFDNLVLRH